MAAIDRARIYPGGSWRARASAGAAALIWVFIVQVPSARAQFGVPMHPPTVAAAEVLHLQPAIGVAHDGDVLDVTSFAPTVAAIYEPSDRSAINGRVGGLLSDFDAVDVGAGLMYEVFDDGPGGASLGLFTQFDIAIGDDTTAAWLSGPLIGVKVPVAQMEAQPYVGFGAGLTEFDNGDLAAFSVILGNQLELSKGGAAIVTELSLGLTEGAPGVIFNCGISIPISAGAK